MERWEIKVIAVFGMFLVIFVFISLPIKVSGIIARQGDNAAVILGLLRCFAGGVFVGTIMLHMVPEVHDQVGEFLLEPNGIDYPIAELTLVTGFFLILLFERTILHCEAKNKMKKQETVALTSQIMLHTHVDDPDGTPSILSEMMDDAATPQSTPKPGRKTPSCPRLDHANHTISPLALPDSKMSNGVSMVSNGTVLYDDSKMAYGVHNMENGTTEKPKACIHDALEGNDISKTRSIILILAMSFESIFDGLSVGMQLTQQGTWNMFIAIVSHEFIIGFCLGIELVKHNPPNRVLLSAFLYALVPPIGCTMGILITETDTTVDHDTLEAISGMFISFSAGIFFYCTFIGMLGEELIQDATYKKILAVAVGTGIMAGLAALPDGEDDDESMMTTLFPEVTAAWA